MESRIRLFLLVLCLGMASTLSAAEDKPASAIPKSTAEPMDSMLQQEPVIQPDIKRRQVKEAQIDTENFEVGIFFGMFSIEDFGTDTVVGARLTYHVTEDFFFEGTYGQSEAGTTSAERLYTPQLLTDAGREYSFYTFALGYNLLPGEAFLGRNYAFNTNLYLIAGIGSTEFANDDHFTVVYGAGYRFIIKDWLAIHANVRDHVFSLDVTGEDKNTHNIEISLGATYFF